MLKWAGAALFAQGLDDEAVSQILTKLSQPVEMEDVRREETSRSVVEPDVKSRLSDSPPGHQTTFKYLYL